MNIVYPAVKRLPQFRDVGTGHIFYTGGIVFMKMLQTPVYAANAVSMRDGSQVLFSESEEVMVYLGSQLTLFP